MTLYPHLKPKWHNWKNNVDLEFQIPLFHVLQQIFKKDNVYEYLTEKQFRPLNPRAISEETTLELELKFHSGLFQDKRSKKEKQIDLKLGQIFQKKYILGKEIDLAKESKLEVGKGYTIDWQDAAGVLLAAAKTMTQSDKLQAGITVVDCLIQTHGGYVSATKANYYCAAESTGSVAGAALGFAERFKETSGTLGLAFLIPQLKRLVIDQAAGLPHVIRTVEDGMRTAEYFPLSESRSTADFPIWFNPELKKLGLIGPSGMVHPVKPQRISRSHGAFFNYRKPDPEKNPCCSEHSRKAGGQTGGPLGLRWSKITGSSRP
ncbi:MAG: hypothetical protein SWO11_20325 [Thermodesulfobacteriota bacterium]|nr:hypothetical protein [Thermodesulfobacteriota bacterium]